MGLMDIFTIVSLISSSLMMIVVLSQDLGPKYEIEMQKILLMNESDFIKFDNFRVKRYNKTVHAISGVVSFKIDFGEDWEIKMDCFRSKLGNNQWELTPFKAPQQSICNFVKTIYKKRVQSENSDTSDLPVFKDGDPTCPFPKGDYTLTNHLVDIRNFPPFMHDGLYRVETSFYHENIVKTGIIIYAKIYPEVG